jgi:polar amino acid transport system permease protein
MGARMIDIQSMQEFLPLLVQGAGLTLQIALYVCIIGSIVGTAAALGLASSNKIVKVFIHTYVTIVRGTPMLIQVAATFYLLKISGYHITAFWSAIFSIGLNSGAYLSQVILSGIQSVDPGQTEAAQTLGMTQLQTTRFIILPQAVRTVLPSLGNEFITLVKDSSLASTIGVYELTKQGQIIMSQTYDAPTMYLTVGLIYLLLTSLIGYMVYMLEKKLRIPC